VSDNIIDRLAVMTIGGTNQWERVLAFDARKEIERLREDNNEQCRLHGIGSQREARQLAVIAKLREERLTNEEQAAVSWAVAGLLADADDTGKRGLRERSEFSRKAAATLQELIERHQGEER